MEEEQEEKFPELLDRESLSNPSREIVRELFALSGEDALNRILEQDNCHHLVQNMTRVDFFWLIKKIGENDSLPLLKMASLEQWQYLLDMEIWQKDRLDMDKTSIWLSRLQDADLERLVRWLYRDGISLAHYYFLKNIRVEIKKGGEDYDLPDDFFTLDNLYYIRIMNKKHEEAIGNILRQMAREDYDRYQASLIDMNRFIPTEVEEEMYRMRNMRLNEDGFLPFHEAISVYSYLKISSLNMDQSPYKLYYPPEKEINTLVPITPLLYARGSNFLAESAERISDTSLLDRIRLEFTGICNQILSADGLMVNDIEVLIKICRKAAGYINIGLEKLSGGNLALSEQFLKNNPLISIFRAGFGLALELKWEADKWTKEAWFIRQDLKPDFWGDGWSGILMGISQKRPSLFKGFQEGEGFGDFEQLSEVEDCRIILRRLIVLDRLLETLTARYPLDKDRIRLSPLTFHPLLFIFWARMQLKLDPGFSSLSREQAKDFFSLLRTGTDKPPFRMFGFKDIFIRDFMSSASNVEPDEARMLKEALSILWQKFDEEYAWVATSDIDGRFTNFHLA
ncbi:MAG: hypothetical protein JRJ02_12310 [Deltaproteobacteria bacterium]|nr:hypothetical protein [Deltaproteobacteria bacterium]